MAKLTPQEFAEKYARNTANATGEYTRGVSRVQTAPGQQAAAQAQLAAMKYQQKIADGTWQRNVAAVPLQEWKDAAINKGASRYASGAAAAQGKMARFAEKLLPHIDSGKAKIASMPKGDAASAKARASAWIDHMMQFRKS